MKFGKENFIFKSIKKKQLENAEAELDNNSNNILLQKESTLLNSPITTRFSVKKNDQKASKLMYFGDFFNYFFYSEKQVLVLHSATKIWG